MKLPPNIPVFGDTSYRGKCPKEAIEQVSFFSRLRREYPDTWGHLAVHVRNEGLLEKGQFSAVVKHAAEGMVRGAPDVLIPGSPAMVMEIKRLDHTQSKWQDGQIAYLEAALEAGAFACIALGAVGAWAAFEAYLAHRP